MTKRIFGKEFDRGGSLLLGPGGSEVEGAGLRGSSEGSWRLQERVEVRRASVPSQHRQQFLVLLCSSN